MPEVPKTPDQRVIDGGIDAHANPAQFGNKPVQTPLVEDTTVVGGVDKATGQPVVRPRTPSGGGGAMTEATDPREND